MYTYAYPYTYEARVLPCVCAAAHVACRPRRHLLLFATRVHACVRVVACAYACMCTYAYMHLHLHPCAHGRSVSTRPSGHPGWLYRHSQARNARGSRYACHVGPPARSLALPHTLHSAPHTHRTPSRLHSFHVPRHAHRALTHRLRAQSTSIRPLHVRAATQALVHIWSEELICRQGIAGGLGASIGDTAWSLLLGELPIFVFSLYPFPPP
jgi:hypothetical protein